MSNITGYTTGFTIAGVDIGPNLISKSYIEDVYPGLIDTMKIDGRRLWTWGRNLYGELGDNSITHRSSPVQVTTGGIIWKQISQGNSHTIAIKSDNTLWAWGLNSNGQLGDNSTTRRSSPVQTVSGGTNWENISCGNDFNASIKTDGTLWLWGRNNDGELGDNTRTLKSSPVQTVSSGSNWLQASAGFVSVAAVKTDGTVWTWGNNRYGSLGDNTRTHRSSPVQTVSGGTDWKQVSSGGYHTAAIKTDSTLWLWGRNDYGQLGDNDREYEYSPLEISDTWQELSASAGSLYGIIKPDGTLWAWGTNNYGQQGTGNTIDTYSPVQTISGGNNWQEVAASWSGTNMSAIKTDGTLWSWGSNSYGQLGNNSNIHRSSPVQTVSGGSNWQKVSAGSNFVVAIKTDGTLWNWGSNNYGQLGDNSMDNRSSPVQTVSAGSNWQTVSAGYTSTASIKADGTLWLWGKNSYGQMGDNTTLNRSSPVQTVSSGNNWSQVSSGTDLTAAIKTDGTLWVWGKNSYGQLGDNTSIHRSSPVQTVSGGNNWSQVSSRGTYVGAIKTNGTLWSWGTNTLGQLGDGTRTNRSSPVQTTLSGSNWQEVWTGGNFTAATKTDGTRWIWGANIFDYTNIVYFGAVSPVQTISGGTDWQQVSASRYGTAAIKTDGTLWIWGNNTSGQIGDNTRIHRSSPVQTVSGGTNWNRVASANHTIAIKTDGTLWTWGLNANGQLGDNSRTHRSSPVQTVMGGGYWVRCSAGYNFSAAIYDGAPGP